MYAIYSLVPHEKRFVITTLLSLRINQPMVWAWTGTISLLDQWETGGVFGKTCLKCNPFSVPFSGAIVVLKLLLLVSAPWTATFNLQLQRALCMLHYLCLKKLKPCSSCTRHWNTHYFTKQNCFILLIRVLSFDCPTQSQCCLLN